MYLLLIGRNEYYSEVTLEAVAVLVSEDLNKLKDKTNVIQCIYKYLPQLDLDKVNLTWLGDIEWGLGGRFCIDFCIDKVDVGLLPYRYEYSVAWSNVPQKYESELYLMIIKVDVI